ncbi:MAG TPA: Uma2 family endonuclease [Candidatus Elarobacter sp.]|nr:Uma2 family endonuclease [Candidatus Elarobacter sp.]
MFVKTPDACRNGLAGTSARATRDGNMADTKRQSVRPQTPMSEMAVTAEAPPAPAADEAPYAIRPITVDEYHRMLEAGILYEREPVELLDGQLIAMPPEGPGHGSSVTGLNETLVLRFAGRAYVRPGNALRLSDVSEPQPDFAVVRLREDGYRDALPVPDDVLLLVEISDSTLRYDRGRKLRAYARAGIPEYWIVDLVHGHVDVFTEPNDEGYAGHRIARRDETLAPRAFPEDAIAVSSFLP